MIQFFATILLVTYYVIVIAACITVHGKPRTKPFNGAAAFCIELFTALLWMLATGILKVA